MQLANTNRSRAWSRNTLKKRCRRRSKAIKCVQEKVHGAFLRRSEAQCEVLRLQALKFPVVMAKRIHLYPYRTQQLSSSALTILGAPAPGKISRRRDTKKQTECMKETCIRSALFLSSSMAEHSAVNRRVVSSSLTWGAKAPGFLLALFFVSYDVCTCEMGSAFQEISNGNWRQDMERLFGNDDLKTQYDNYLVVQFPKSQYAAA